MVIKETTLASKMVKIHISIDENSNVKMRIYPINAEEICKALAYCNTIFRQVEDLNDFIIEFVRYMNDCIYLVDEPNNGYYRDILDPIDIMVDFKLDLGCLEYSKSKINNGIYIEKQWVNHDVRFNLGHISASTIIIASAIALCRKALLWEDLWLIPNDD